MYKGGPVTGLYIILIGDEEKNVAISGEKFGFATLYEAQALGDVYSLDDKRQRVIRVNLGENIDQGLNKLFPSVKEAKQHPIQELVM